MTDTTTHAALALPSAEHVALLNDSYRISVKWGGGQARVHVRQFQPHNNDEYAITWQGDAANADPDDVLREVLKHWADKDTKARTELFALSLGELDWYAPVSMPRSDRAHYGLLETAK
ncbi:hypothetical protein AB0G73_10805 [Streptomyces sp. NPDC020719]|uniref:hypothetical protein n=1 Tax=Streptomyces sp. NPDC020719 TaxID=3154896 RepID=UPI0033EE15A8